jgi:hypothetical protein
MSHNPELSAADLELLFDSTGDDRLPTAATPTLPTPVADAARAAVTAFVSDGARVKTSKVGDDVVIFIITTRPAHGRTGPTVYAGLEPHRTVREADDFAVLENGDRVVVEVDVAGAVHTAWGFHLEGDLVRVWARGRTGNENERFYVAKRTGAVKEVDRLTYSRLRKALEAQPRKARLAALANASGTPVAVPEAAHAPERIVAVATTPAALPLDTVAFHNALLGRPPSAHQAELYARSALKRGFSGVDLDAEKAEATVVLAFHSARDARTYVVVPKALESAVTEAIRAAAKAAITAAGADADAARQRGAELRPLLASIGLWTKPPPDIAPAAWVAAGYEASDLLPRWLQQGLLRKADVTPAAVEACVLHEPDPPPDLELLAD